MFPQPVHSWTNAGGVAENSPARKGWEKNASDDFSFRRIFRRAFLFPPLVNSNHRAAIRPAVMSTEKISKLKGSPPAQFSYPSVYAV
jgi:hypothetical protein